MSSGRVAMNRDVRGITRWVRDRARPCGIVVRRRVCGGVRGVVCGKAIVFV